MESHKHLQLPKLLACKISAAVLWSIFCFNVHAQQKLYGNISIPSGSQATLFGNQTFAGGSGVSAAIVRVGRTLPVGLLSFSQNMQISGAGTNGFVDGYVRKYGSARFIFPVGHDGFYGPFAAAADKTYGAYFHADPSMASFPTISRDVSVSGVTTKEYWDINGANQTKLTLTWNAESNISTFLSRIEKLTLVGWKDGSWVVIPSKLDATSVLGGSSTLLAGSITSLDPLVPNNYEVYTLGSLAGSLPVTLTRFDAKAEGPTALLDWATSFESNSDHFEIERSQKGKLWQNIGQIASFKESISRREYRFVDPKPLSGENLYRLKMVDADSTFAYSSIQSVSFDLLSNADFIYPNPASTSLKFHQNTLNLDRQKLNVTDMNGRDRTGAVFWKENALDIHNLENGTYIISVSDKKGSTTKSKVVVLK